MSIGKLPLDPRNVINGTYGMVYINNSTKVAEVTKFNAKITMERADVPLAGSLIKGKKLTGVEISGELTVNHVRDLFVQEVVKNISKGKDTYISFTSVLADPDAKGKQQYVVKNAVLNDLTLADFEVGKNGERTYAFTATDIDVVQTVEAKLG